MIPKILLITFVTVTLLGDESKGEPEMRTPCSSKCVPFKECTSAIKLWTEFKTIPVICFFDEETGTIPYVCCLEDEPINCQLVVKDDNKVDLRIENGIETDERDFPFMVALAWDLPFYEFFGCGGSLIHKFYVLTAAHCSFNRGKYRPLRYAIIGGRPIKNDSSIISINGINQHPEYNPKRKYNDIAILRLAEEVSNQPACIPPPSYNLPIETEVIAAGYGKTSFFGNISENLLKADLLLHNQTDCLKFYGELMDSQLCALSTQITQPNRTIPVRSDTCRGDSGGPLIKKNSLIVVGIISFGFPCGSGYPGVYTKTSSYYDWIYSKISS